jgi:hypothetical protein
MYMEQMQVWLCSILKHVMNYTFLPYISSFNSMVESVGTGRTHFVFLFIQKKLILIIVILFFEGPWVSNKKRWTCISHFKIPMGIL